MLTRRGQNIIKSTLTIIMWMYIVDLNLYDCVTVQKFLSHNIQYMKATKNWWENGFWIGLSDTNSEGTWVWINNVTEVEQR